MDEVAANGQSCAKCGVALRPGQVVLNTWGFLRPWRHEDCLAEARGTDDWRNVVLTLAAACLSDDEDGLASALLDLMEPHAATANVSA